METFDKMIMFDYKDYKNILIKAVKLAEKKAFNEKLEIRVKQEYIPGSNIIEYLLNENSRFKKDLDKYLDEKNIYTKVSPLDYKLNKKDMKWIQT